MLLFMSWFRRSLSARPTAWFNCCASARHHLSPSLQTDRAHLPTASGAASCSRARAASDCRSRLLAPGVPVDHLTPVNSIRETPFTMATGIR